MDRPKFKGSTAMSSSSSQVRSLVENLLMCPICMDSLVHRNPRMLECLHTFCHNCLSQHVEYATARGTTSVISCPVCRAKTKRPIRELPVNPLISQINDLVAFKSRTDTCVKCWSRDVDQSLQCPICLAPMHNVSPVALDCYHTFCHRCLQRIVSANQGFTFFGIIRTSIKCPVCRNKTHIPSGGVKKLPINFAISQTRDMLEAVKQMDVCSKCWEFLNIEQAESACLVCQRFFCENCYYVHNSYPQFAKHHTRKLRQPEPAWCQKHRKTCAYVCNQCTSDICTDCVLGGLHDSHKDAIEDLENNWLQKLQARKWRDSKENVSGSSPHVNTDSMSDPADRRRSANISERGESSVMPRSDLGSVGGDNSVTPTNGHQRHSFVHSDDSAVFSSPQRHVGSFVDTNVFFGDPRSSGLHVRTLGSDDDDMFSLGRRPIESDYHTTTHSVYEPVSDDGLDPLGSLPTSGALPSEGRHRPLLVSCIQGSDLPIVYPKDIVALMDGTTVVADLGLTFLFRMNQRGSLLCTYGPQSGTKSNRKIQSVAADDRDIFFCCLGPASISKVPVDPTARPSHGMSYPITSHGLTSIAVDSSGNFLVGDCHSKRLTKYNSRNSEVLWLWQLGIKPMYVTVAEFGGQEHYLITDMEEGVFEIWKVDGKELTEVIPEAVYDPGVARPCATSVGPNGNILLADQANHTVSEYKPDGSFVRHLLTYSDGIRHPTGLSYNKHTRRLWLTECQLSALKGPCAIKVFSFPVQY